MRAKSLDQRLQLLDQLCGVGLYEGMLVNGDSLHAESKWIWSGEFRRILGFESEQDFPNVAESWSDLLHPEDRAATLDAFGESLQDRTGKLRYACEQRLKTKSGAYRWYRASGGCVWQADGRIVRASGSLVDIHEQKLMLEKIEQNNLEDQRTMAALGKALQVLAQGDLTHRIDVSSVPSKSAQISENFNESTANLAVSLTSVVDAATQIRNGTKEISEASSSLALRTERQAASLEETAAAVQQITSTARGTAERAAELASLANAAHTSVRQSGEIVGSAVLAMSRIDASSKEIGQIIDLIDQIAFQTNLLALNAGVEAARAGEAGKGFSVVAQEVRELAQRSAEAARRITWLVSSSSSEVKEGVSLVGKIDENLGSITTQVTEMLKLISEISSSAREQSIGLSQVNNAVRSMDQVTQENAAMVEQTTAASHALATEANRLAVLTGAFQLTQTDNRSPRLGVDSLPQLLRA